jgi:transposase
MARGSLRMLSRCLYRPCRQAKSCNLGSHKRAGVRKAIEAAGAAVCFLPAYSPDFDPIEQVFAKLKNTLRKMARRTVDALWDAIGIALDDFSPEECFNYFRDAGYGST